MFTKAMKAFKYFEGKEVEICCMMGMSVYLL